MYPVLVQPGTFELRSYGVILARSFFRGTPAILAWDIPAAQVFGAVLVTVAIAGFHILGRASGKPA